QTRRAERTRRAEPARNPPPHHLPRLDRAHPPRVRPAPLPLATKTPAHRPTTSLPTAWTHATNVTVVLTGQSPVRCMSRSIRSGHVSRVPGCATALVTQCLH